MTTTCTTCGGTVLEPTRTGVPRGTCHCPSNLGTRFPLTFRGRACRLERWMGSMHALVQFERGLHVAVVARAELQPAQGEYQV